MGRKDAPLGLWQNTGTVGEGGREGCWGSWLTDEPHSLQAQSHLWVLQVALALVQVVLGPAPVLCQLETGEGCRVGTVRPPLLSQLPTQLPAMWHWSSEGADCSSGMLVPSWWQGLPREDPRLVGTVLTKRSRILHACSVPASCASLLQLRKRPALRRASWEAWGAAEMPPPLAGAQDPVPPLLAELRACPGAPREDAPAGK